MSDGRWIVIWALRHGSLDNFERNEDKHDGQFEKKEGRQRVRRRPQI